MAKVLRARETGEMAKQCMSVRYKLNDSSDVSCERSLKKRRVSPLCASLMPNIPFCAPEHTMFSPVEKLQ
ncbi:unnamed protein product, partial [Brenthis ino]